MSCFFFLFFFALLVFSFSGFWFPFPFLFPPHTVRGISGSGDAVPDGAHAVETVDAGRDARYLRRDRHQRKRCH